MSFLGIKNDDITVFCNDNLEDDLAMFELSGGNVGIGGTGIGVGVGVDINNNDNNYDIVVIDGPDENVQKRNNFRCVYSKDSKKRKQKKETKLSYYDGLFEGYNSSEPIYINDDDDDDDENFDGGRKSSRRPVPLIYIDDDDDNDNDNDNDDDDRNKNSNDVTVVAVVTAASSLSSRSAATTTTTTTPSTTRRSSNNAAASLTASIDSGNHGGKSVRSRRRKGKTNINNIYKVPKSNSNSSNNEKKRKVPVDAGIMYTTATRTTNTNVMTANVQKVNRKRNRPTSQEENKKRKEKGKYAVIKKKQSACVKAMEYYNGPNRNSKIGYDKKRSENEVGRKKNIDRSLNFLPTIRKEKERDKKCNNDNVDDDSIVVEGGGGGGSDDGGRPFVDNHNIEKKKRRGKNKNIRLEKIKEGHNNYTNYRTNQEVFMSQDDMIMAEDRPISIARHISPQSVLYHYYEKKPGNIKVTANNYLSWENNDEYGTKKQYRQQQRLFTSIFVCPITKEAFLAGPWGGGEIENVQQLDRPDGLYWYSSNSLAKHAAAARAWDCLLLREGGNLIDFRLGELEPYRLMQRPAWLSQIKVPSRIQKRLSSHEYSRYFTMHDDFSTSHNAANSSGTVMNVSGSNAIIDTKRTTDRSRLPGDITDLTSERNGDDEDSHKNMCRRTEVLKNVNLIRTKRDDDYDNAIVLSKNKNSNRNVRHQINVFKNGDLIRKKQVAIAQTIAPEKKAISLQQEKIFPTMFDQTNDVTVVTNSHVNTIQNKLNSVSRGKDHWVYQKHKELFQKQQQQYAVFGRCQKQLWKKNPQAVQTTTKNRLSKKDGSSSVGGKKILVKIFFPHTGIVKKQIHETEKDVIGSDEKSTNKGANISSCVQESFNDENSGYDVTLVSLKTKKRKKNKEINVQGNKKVGSKKYVPLVALNKKNENTTCVCLPHVHSKNLPTIRINSSSQKQSINTCTNDITNGIETEKDRDKSFDSALKFLHEESTPDTSSDPIKEDTVTKISIQNQSQQLKSTENELGETLSADKTKGTIKSNGIVGIATTCMTNDTHVNTFIEKESHLKDVRRDEAKISLFLEHVYGLRPGISEKQQTEIIDVDAVECMEPSNEYKNTCGRKKPNDTNVRTEKAAIKGEENTKASNSDSFSYIAKHDYNIPVSKSIESKGTAGNLTLAGKFLPTKPRFKPQKNRKTKKAEKGSIDFKQNEIMTNSNCAPINPKSHTSSRDNKCLPEKDSLKVNLSHSHDFLSSTDEERLPKNNHSRFEHMPSNLNSSRFFPPSPERRFVFHSSNSKAKLATKPVHTDSFMGMSLKDALIEQDRLIRGAAARVRTQATFRVISQCERMSNLICPRTFKVVVRDIHLRYSDHWEYTDYYSRLGLPRNANESTVKSAYRRLCLVYHPDRNRKLDTKHKFQAVAEAYNSLMNVQIT